MNVVVVGLGVQGRKRIAIAGSEVRCTVDVEKFDADFRGIEQVPLDSYEAAIVCTQDDAKIGLLTFLLENRKHVLVEKPLVAADSTEIAKLKALAEENGVTCYTAYNHRFEPHFVRLKEMLDSGELGEVYLVRLFYGNGTARDVKGSPWRDREAGVLPDLGSHLLDTVLFWFGEGDRRFDAWSFNRFENGAFDHFTFGSAGRPVLELEVTLLSWRNDFRCDVFAERGTAHIDSLCKWGPAMFTRRGRVLPSGRPDEESTTLVSSDPTWALEYEHFKALCRTGGNNLANDLWINEHLASLAHQSIGVAR